MCRDSGRARPAPFEHHESPLRRRVPAPGDAGHHVALAGHQGRRPRDEGALHPGQAVARRRSASTTRTCCATRSRPGMHIYMAEINRKVKEVVPRALSIFGGPHPTFCPEYVEERGHRRHLPRRGRARDRRAPEQAAAPARTIYDIAELLVQAPRDRRDHQERRSGRWSRTSTAGLPRPRRGLRGRARSTATPTARCSSASAAARCTAPSASTTRWKKKVYGVRNNEYVRKRSVDHLLARSRRCGRSTTLKFVHFVDDIFNLRNDWLEEFCERYPKEIGLPVRRDPDGQHDHGAPHPAPGQGRLRLRAHRLRGRQRLRAQRDLPQEHDAPAARRRRRLDPQARHPARLAEHARRPRRDDRGRVRHDAPQHRVQGRPPAGLAHAALPDLRHQRHDQGDGLRGRRLRRLPGQVQPHLVDPVRAQARDREPAQAVPDRRALPVADALRPVADQAEAGSPSRS